MSDSHREDAVNVGANFPIVVTTHDETLIYRLVNELIKYCRRARI